MIYIPRILGASLTHFSESLKVCAPFSITPLMAPPSTVLSPPYYRPPTLCPPLLSPSLSISRGTCVQVSRALHETEIVLSRKSCPVSSRTANHLRLRYAHTHASRVRPLPETSIPDTLT